ncbi:class I SAM-dependent methyltransferase [Marilutibacter aestuarii]|uniref:class I SAM-dependent methyltransferase n=1 Tax=Marilutibacter aestuarii TaxID=1706195 RepID=UPI0014769C03|nr:class I SAM-dependent methyltransferase [Lysobacter aestuarii]
MTTPEADQRHYWDGLSELDPDAAVIDPNDHRGLKNAYLASIRDRAFKEGVDRRGIRQGTVLDLGCGSGSSTLPLLREGHSVVGVDISPGLLRHASIRCQNEDALFVLTDGRCLPLARDSLDAAVTYVVLSYIVDDARVLRVMDDVRQALSPGAPFIMIEQARRRRRTMENGRKVQRTLTEWSRLLALAGFTLERRTILRHGRFPSTPLIRAGLLPSRAWGLARRMEAIVASRSGVFPWDYAEVCFEASA